MIGSSSPRSRGRCRACALVILHVARSLDRIGIEVALELLEDLAVGLADDVGQHVEPAAVGHAHHDLGHAGAGRGVEQSVEQDDGRLGPFEPEALLPDVARVEKALEHLGRVEPIQDVALLLDLQGRRLPLDVLLDPALLLGVLDVHVLDRERPAVRVAQHVEDLVERRHVAPGQPVRHELARQVPDGEAVGQRVELGMDVRRFRVERVEVGDQVAAHPVHVDERLHVHLLDQALVLALVGPVAGVVVDLPAHRLVGDAHRLEEVVVEPVRAGQERRDTTEEQAGLRALDDPVVVRRRERHDLAQAQLGEHTGVGSLEARRVPQRADADDGALSRHEPGHGLHGAERPGVGERHRRPGEVVGSDLVGVDLADELLVGEDEGAEVERVGVLDARDQQRARPVALLPVDREAEPDVLVVDDAGLAGAVGVRDEGGVQRRHVVQRAHDGVPDDVREADLGPRRPGQLVVQDEPVDLEQAGRHAAHARRGRHRQAGLHVGHDPRGRAPQQHGILASRHDGGSRSRGGGRPAVYWHRGRRGCCRRNRRGGRTWLRRRHGGRAVVREELTPAL